MAAKKDGYYSWTEVAKVLGCSVKEAKRIYEEAMQKLMKDARFQKYFYEDNLLY